MSLVWLPLAESGVPTSFLGGGAVSLTLSNIVCVAGTQPNSNWSLSFIPQGTPRTVRLISNAFASSAASSIQGFLNGVPGAPIPNGDAPPAIEFLPNPVPLVGIDAVTFTPAGAGTFAYDWTVELLVEQPDVSTDPGRTTRGYMTAYNLARVQKVRCRRYLKRCLETVLPGNLPEDVLIVSAQWLATSPWVVVMSEPRLRGRAKRASVMIEGNYSGHCYIRCQMLLSTGEVWNYEYDIEVLDAPLYPSDTYLPSAGPYTISTP